MSKRMRLLMSVLLGTAAIVGWIIWGNTALQVTQYTVESADLPEGFDGFRIAHVSDLHNAEFGAGNSKLLALLKENAPDIIVITGDIVDSRRTDIDAALHFVQEAVKIAPCYYVTGNHEARVREYGRLETGMLEAGVCVLRDLTATVSREGQSIRILGLDDRSFTTESLFLRALAAMAEKKRGFTILLSHRPEYFPSYCAYPVDLVLSGHTHGGQVRLPWLGGVLIPNQGWFGKYDAGQFTQLKTSMIISRGLGNSLFPFRVNDRPELVIITLKSQS